MDTAKYINLFVAETREHLVALNQALLALEKNPEDGPRLDEIFRSMHTVKGMAASIGLDFIADLTHRGEDLLDRMRKRQSAAAGAEIDTIFAVLDFLEEAVGLVASGQQPGEELIQRSRELGGRIASLTEAKESAGPAKVSIEGGCDFKRIRPLMAEGSRIYKIRILLEQDVSLKSARAFLILHTLERDGKIAYTVPERHDLEAERFDRGFSIFLVSSQPDPQTVKESISSAEIEDIQIEELREESAEQALERKTIGAFVQLAQDKAKDRKVTVARLDSLMTLGGELVGGRERLKQRALQTGDPAIQDGVDKIALIASDLQQEVLTARLVPMSEVLDRFPRVVRDAAKGLGKEIDFQVSGRELEMDRSILQMLSEPIIHLLRNSVDHGVEMPQQRKQAGKSQVGTITLSASKQKDQVLIRVADDGKGFDAERIRRKVVDNGYLSADQASALSEPQLYEYLLLPGFSTAEKVSDLSGRGVGLDVVKRRIEDMGGSFSMESRPGQGSSFSITVPLSLAIIRTLLISADQQTYAVPIAQVKETTSIRARSVRTLQGRRMLQFRNRVIPLVSLSRAIGLPRESEPDEGPALIVDRHGSELALLFDRMIGQQEIVVKPLSRFLKGQKYFSGTTISREGRPMLILDFNNITL
jgi:two-component system chemotaxis sensor kinase CheA